MRLTLRTLLAYLDEILDPQDAGELGTKVRESDYASSLVHRIRSVCGRLRLSSPPPLGSGLGADANTVSEYLDNTMAAGRVPEFEKVCLESDMHLAEVASCHQVLTLVLGEPANIDNPLRQRMHALGLANKTADPVVQPSNDVVPAETEDHAGRMSRVDRGTPAVRPQSNSGQHNSGPWREEDTPVRSRTEAAAVSAAQPVPDYVEPQPAMRFSLPALLGGVLLTAAVLYGLSGFLGGGGQQQAQNTEAVDSAPDTRQPATPVVPGAAPIETTGAPLADTNGTRDPNGFEPISPSSTAIDNGSGGTREMIAPLAAPAAENSVMHSTGSAPPIEPTTTGDQNLNVPPPQMPRDGGEFVAVPPIEAMPQNAGDVAPVEGAGGSGFVAQPSPDVVADLAVGNEPRAIETRNMNTPVGTPPAEPPTNSLAVTDTNPPMALNDAAADISSRTPVAEPTAPPADTAANAPPTVPEDIGRFVSEDQVLALWNPGTQSWQRLPPRAPLMAGYLVRVPTMFRPLFVLQNDMQLTLNGRSELQFDVDEQQPVLDMAFGQAIFSAFGDHPEVRLRIDGEVIVVKLEGSQSQFALEVSPLRAPGGVTATGIHAKVWPISGGMTTEWQGHEQQLSTGQVWHVRGGKHQIANAKQPPKWVEFQPREIDRRARAQLHTELASDRSLTLGLREAVDSKRSEVASLAARCLASLDEFGPLLQTFSELKHRSAWQSHFEELHAGLARGDDAMDAIRTAAAEWWGPDAERFTRMVIGYDAKALALSGAEELVEALEDERLEARILAIEALRQITGVTHIYRAEKPPARRRDSVRQWRRSLEAGEIRYPE